MHHFFGQGVSADASTPYQIDADRAETIIANQGMVATMIRTNGSGQPNAFTTWARKVANKIK